MGETTAPEAASAVREKYSVLIPHPSGPRAWMVPCGEGWSLPEFVPEREIHNLDLPHARRMVAEQLGVDLSVRYALRLFEPALPGALNLFVLERGRIDQQPARPGRWIGRPEVAGLPMPLPRQRAALASWLAEEAGERLPTLDLPWWREGWLAETEAWLPLQAEQVGYAATGPAERLRSAYTAAIVRLPAQPADLYLKAMPPPLAHEGPLLVQLSERHPALCPTILATDPERGWMLMSDMGGRSLGSDAPFEQWARVAQSYAEIQVAAAPLVEHWLTLGCLDLRLDRLDAEMEPLFAEEPARLRGLKEALSAEERGKLQERAGQFHALVAELAVHAIPMSLEHGDLHAGNVRIGGEGPIFYDWSHACVTHPFFGLADLIADDDWFPDQPDFNDRVRDVYLEPWTAYRPMRELRAAYQLSQPLRELYRALHQGRLIAAYQQRLGDADYIPETPTGDSFQHLQWWLAHQLRKLIRMER